MMSGNIFTYNDQKYSQTHNSCMQSEPDYKVGKNHARINKCDGSIDEFITFNSGGAGDNWKIRWVSPPYLGLLAVSLFLVGFTGCVFILMICLA